MGLPPQRQRQCFCFRLTGDETGPVEHRLGSMQLCTHVVGTCEKPSPDQDAPSYRNVCEKHEVMVAVGAWFQRQHTVTLLASKHRAVEDK